MLRQSSLAMSPLQCALQPPSHQHHNTIASTSTRLCAESSHGSTGTSTQVTAGQRLHTRTAAAQQLTGALWTQDCSSKPDQGQRWGDELGLGYARSQVSSGAVLR